MFTLTFLPNLNIPGSFMEYKYSLRYQQCIISFSSLHDANFSLAPCHPIYFLRKIMFTLTFLPNLNIPGMCFTEYKYAFSQHGLYIPTKTSCVHNPAQETRTSCNVKLPDPGKWVR